MPDIDGLIGRAERFCATSISQAAVTLVPDLVAALKVARAERNNAAVLSEDIIAHVLADIDQVNDSDWPLRDRLSTIQKICDGSEYIKWPK